MNSDTAVLSADDDRPSGAAGLARQLLALLRPHLGRSLLVLGAICVELVFNTALPLSFKFMIDQAVLPHNGALLIALLAGLAVLFVLSGGAGIVRKYLTASIGADVLNDVRRKLFDHLQRLPMSFYVAANSGDLMSHFTNDLAPIETLLVRSLPLALLSALEVVASAVIACFLDWRLGLLAVALVPITIVGPRLTAAAANTASLARKMAEAAVAGVIQENIAAQAVIKALRLEQPKREQLETELGVLARASARLGFFSGLVGRTADLGIMLSQLVVIGGGAYLAFNGALSIGALFAFIGLLLNLGTALFDLTQALPDWIQASGGFVRINQLLSARVTIEDEPQATTLPPLRTDVRLDDVTFGYDPGHPTLSHASLAVRAGEHAAVVGRSGSGKSTILNLLARFYDPTSGAVLVDGRDVRSVTQDSLRSQVIMVFQEPFLFRGTIRANIAIGDPAARDQDVEAAARAVDLHDVIVSMPEGYDSSVGERGSALSGGQRQRIALARALLRRPAVLLLDEVSSALDPHTESAINASIRRLRRQCTIVEVTHRLESVVDCDRIFVLDAGTVVEHGSHTELLRTNGIYARLWNEQTGFTISADGYAAAVSPARLAAVPIFQLVSPANLSALAGRFVSETFESDETVVSEGDLGDKFYIIVRGQVDVVREAGGEAQRVVAVLQDGDFFGEIALLNDVTRTASVRARAHSLLLSLSRADFLDLVNREPDLARAVREAARLRLEANAAGLMATPAEADDLCGNLTDWR